jgi:hypothetical protein
MSAGDNHDVDAGGVTPTPVEDEVREESGEMVA